MKRTLSREGGLYKQLRSVRATAVRVRKGLGQVHSTASVHPSVRAPRDLVVDEYGYVGPECYLAPMTTIGAYTLLAPRVAIVGGDHVSDIVGTPIQFTGRPEQRATTIGRDAWIGYGAIISRGVTIGEGAIIGAGSIVTKDVPPYEVWVGNPARKLRDRFTPTEAKRHSDALDRGDFAVRFAASQEDATQ